MTEKGKQTVGEWFAQVLDLKSLIIIVTVVAGCITTWATLSTDMSYSKVRIGNLEGQVSSLNHQVTVLEIKNDNMKEQLDKISQDTEAIKNAVLSVDYPPSFVKPKNGRIKKF